MAYISYFDLLGTRGFCENPQIYKENIDSFFEVVTRTTVLLKDYGRTGIFSDCAYVESSDLVYLLEFMTNVQETLMSKGLFINGTIKKGTLQMDLDQTVSGNAYAIKFEGSDIADLYISQNRFKGVGISIDSQLYPEIQQTGFKVNSCFYVGAQYAQASSRYAPVNYWDLAYPKPRYGNKSIEHSMQILLKVLYSAYVKSPKYGAYYISALCNMIRSYCKDFTWDNIKQDFVKTCTVTKSILKLLEAHDEALGELPCVEYLALILLDEVYKAANLTEDDKRNITKRIVNIECVKKKFIHSLNEIPNGIFSKITDSDGKIVDNKETFVRFCQDDLSLLFVESILN